MSINPNFLKKRKYGQDIPREVAELEKNISDALSNIAMSAWPKLVPTSLKTANYSAMLDDLVVCSGTFTVTLPAPSSTNAGRTIGISVSSGTISVAAVSGFVQGVQTDAVKARGVFLFVSDGVGWSRPGGVSSVTVGTGLTGGGTGDITIGLDSNSVLTNSALTAITQPLRIEFELIKLLMAQILKFQLEGAIDNGVEALLQ